MADLLTALGSLFTFLFTQLGNFADFFTSNTLGQILLGLIVFSVISSIVMSIIKKK